MRTHPIKQPKTIEILLSNKQCYSIPMNRVNDLIRILENIKFIKKLEPRSNWMTIEELVEQDVAIYTKPGVTLSGARHKEGLTQIELAARLGIRQENLSKMEHGKRPISLSMAKRLAKVLKIDYRVFL
jgi:DNA-binding XRE family transcriptional regulator